MAKIENIAGYILLLAIGVEIAGSLFLLFKGKSRLITLIELFVLLVAYISVMEVFYFNRLLLLEVKSFWVYFVGGNISAWIGGRIIRRYKEEICYSLFFNKSAIIILVSVLLALIIINWVGWFIYRVAAER